MNAIVTADLHWSDNPRDAYRHQFVEWLAKQCHEADALIILGDLTEAKDEHGAWLVNKVVGHIHRLASVCPVIILRGNHDFINPDFPFFNFVERLDNVYWINGPHGCNYGPIAGLGLDEKIGRTLFLPHTADYAKDWQGFKFNEFDWIFTHNTFQGSDYGQGPLARGIPVDIFTGDVAVVSGDIHIPQRVGPVRYVGAPYLVDFGDDYEPRIFSVGIKGTAGRALNSIDCQGPQKRLVAVRDIAALKAIKSVTKGDIVKVRIDLTPEDHARWPEMQAAAKAWGEKLGVIIQTVQPMVIREQAVKTSAARAERAKRDDTFLVREYVRQRGVDDATEKTGIRLVRQG